MFLAAMTVMVCLDAEGKSAAIDPGRAAASRIFERAGIRLQWRNTLGACAAKRGIVVTLAFQAPADRHPGALAYALPYDRTHVVLLYGRVLNAVPPPAAPSLMGYVLAHEICHVLQGVARHSATGIMKAHWDHRDYDEMQLGRLAFTEEDLLLMR
jgi:hypothetical protein